LSISSAGDYLGFAEMEQHVFDGLFG